MTESLTKICRICLTEGSRNIFQRAVAKDALYNVSSLNRISEKLRYVTLLKIDEMENLPAMICDLCIVQLNVAYNFKRQATESDTKLRQYLIENGIDIMKDPLAIASSSTAVTSPRGGVTGSSSSSTTTSANTLRAITASRTNVRCNSTASSSVQELPAGFHGRLQPIRIKVETPETTEQSSEGGDLMPNLSPLSTATSATAPTTVGNVESVSVGASNSSTNGEQIVVDSSPASSKGGYVCSGRDSVMVMVDSRNVSMHGDDDYVQNILGSNSSIASKNKKDLEKDTPVAPPVTKREVVLQKKLKHLMSTLSINMVTNARFPSSKLRIKPRKKLQKAKGAPVGPRPASVKPAMKRSRSVVGEQKTPVKMENSESKRNQVGRQNAHMISPGKLQSLREKIREEKSRGNEADGEHSKRARKIPTVDLTETDRPGSSKARGIKTRLSIS